MMRKKNIEGGEPGVLNNQCRDGLHLSVSDFLVKVKVKIQNFVTASATPLFEMSRFVSFI